ncbi:MAG: hypothetical protein FWF29_09520, partial [Treponema sp.]|nr:hypothetical protein [Treponema sp.]
MNKIINLKYSLLRTHGPLCFLLLLPLLLSNCDMFGGSVNNFIGFNTGTVKAAIVSVPSLYSKKLIATQQAWMHDPSDIEDGYAGIIQFEVKIANQHKYDLSVTAAIHEFIGEDGEKIYDPSLINRPIEVSGPL